METPVTFLSHDFQLMGVVHTPDNLSGHLPAVLFLHGFTGTKVEPHRIFVKTARALVKKGFVAMRFDFRGSGDSGGECEDSTLSAQIADAATAIAFFSKNQHVDPKRIGIVGMSFGGSVACHLAAANSGVKSLAMWCPVADGDAILNKMATPKTTTAMMSTGFADYSGWRISHRFVQEFSAMRPADELAKSACPVLICHGTADNSVPVDQVYVFEKAVSGNNRKFKKVIIHDADHTFDRADWEDTVIKETVEWLEKTL